MSRASEIRGKATRTITTQGGFEIVIRRPAVIDLVESGLGPLVAGLLPPGQEKVAKMLSRGPVRAREDEPSLDELVPAMVAFCSRIMKDPRLHVGEGEPPDDAITAGDLGDELFEVFSQAMAFYGEGVKGAADAAARFRLDPNGSAGESGGATVSDPTVETAPSIPG